ncbi:thermonuclease family protein (plasmid) [Acinetobacter indicus]|uniref:thermonuclease family protein n=1 Tax=Acinetobacter indicus TaxID=756892 RepID=UPI001FA7881F|nr:thermonuclease family protein [Acinetobacter indicus]UNW11162.1 thermonuclease family protein [Acinetobacter indicus]
MIKFNFSILVLLSVSSLTYADFYGRVVGVSDGDTITVLTAEKQQYRVRMMNIDAPEKGQPYGEQAKQFLSNLVYNSQVYVQDHGQDQYNRVLGTVLKGNDNVNRMMVRYGYAWAYRKYLKDPVMIDLETYAQQQKIGMWKDAQNITPEQWRKMNRYK